MVDLPAKRQEKEAPEGEVDAPTSLLEEGGFEPVPLIDIEEEQPNIGQEPPAASESLPPASNTEEQPEEEAE